MAYREVTMLEVKEVLSTLPPRKKRFGSERKRRPQK